MMTLKEKMELLDRDLSISENLKLEWEIKAQIRDGLNLPDNLCSVYTSPTCRSIIIEIPYCNVAELLKE